MADHEPPRLVWTPDLVRRFWDWQSRRPEEYFTRQFGARIVRRFRPHLRGRASILDYGCGTGFLIDHLLAAGHRVAGLDFSPEAVAGVNARMAGRDGFLGAFTPDEIQGRDQLFDAVVCCEVIEHLYDEDLDHAFTVMLGLLAPDGSLCLTTPNAEDLSLLEVYDPVADVVFHRWQHVRSWDRASLTGFLAGRHLRVAEAGEVDFSTDLVGDPVRWAKVLAKRRLGRGQLPHLYCVAERAS